MGFDRLVALRELVVQFFSGHSDLWWDPGKLDFAAPILFGVVAIAMTLIAFVSASRANRAQSKATTVTIEAGAYARARESYESALSTVREEVAGLRAEISSLRQSNDRLRDQITSLTNEITRLRS